MWSKWQWVRRIASTVTPSSSTAFRMRSASSPGSTIRARSEPSARNRKQFSATGPTVNERTSRSGILATHLLRALALLVGLAPPVHDRVDEVADRDVEDEHEGCEAERLKQ